MNQPDTCSQCGSMLFGGAHFCPSCGYPASVDLANPFDRFCAAAVDIPIWLALSGVLVWLGLKWWLSFAVWTVLTELGYQLKGSIGKSLVGLSIPVRSRYQHYLRETIGKLASLAIFGIGFLMILSKEHLALHDYMAKTRVLRVSKLPRVRLAVITLCLLLGVAAGGYHLARPKTQSQPLASSFAQQTSLDSIVSRIPAVATLYVYNIKGKVIGQGSGFLVSSNGVGVTNFHVIRDAYSADAKLGDGRLYNVLAIQGYDPDRDVAIFRLGRKTSAGVEEPQDLPFLSVATDEVQVGDRIATIGSPEGLASSVSDGLVSAIRTDGGQRFFQISAPISAGSSGGPVLNLKGEVVAISAFQFIEGQNLNFAIPADEIATVQARKEDVPVEQLYWRLHLFAPKRSSALPGDNERTAPGAPLTGTFVGTVHNLSADLQANFGIFIEQSQEAIYGCMAVRKPLFGSGSLLGSVSGTLVRFDVTSPSFQIQFEGVRSGNRVSGTYSVPSPDGTYQRGEFVLDKADGKRLPHDFDPQKDCPTDADMNH